MKQCIYYKMLWNRFSYNIEISANITRWLIGFGWVSGSHGCVHFNLGPIAVSFYRSIDE